MNPSDWLQFLAWLVVPSSITIAVGVVLSVVVEYLPNFDALDPKWKRVVVFALSLVVPVLAQVCRLASNVEGLAWADWATTWWPVVVAGVTSFASATVTHIRKL